jgi:hypothetical protein
VDVFKDYIPHIPYYFGNSDVMINNDMFTALRDVFVSKSLEKHPALIAHIEPKRRYNDVNTVIHDYFRELLGGHYIEAAGAIGTGSP